MVKLRAFVAIPPLLSLTVTWMVKKPDTAGVPLSPQLILLKFALLTHLPLTKPLGKPVISIVNLSYLSLSDAAIETEYL